jgi:glycosyltransferase involved in cell wall biosynthesis
MLKHKKKKISYFCNLSDQKSNISKTEGLLSLFLKLNKHFGKQYFVSSNNNSKQNKGDLIHICSSGFSEVITFKKIIKRSIYSLYSNVNSPPIKMGLDYLQNFHYFYDSRGPKGEFKRLVRTMKMIASHLVPISLKRYYLNKPKLVVLPNNYTAKLLKLNNYVVIPPGINVKKFTKKRVIKKDNKINVAFFGHPTAPKGLLEVINSFSKLSSQEYNKQLFLSFKNKKIVKTVHKIDKTIKITGFCPNIIEEYNQSDIVVLPYRHNAGAIANPLVLLEAMSCGKAIITTNVPNIKEIGKNAVTYVEPYSVKQIVKAIKYLKKNHSIREELGKKARKVIIQHYDEKDMFKKYFQIYKKAQKIKEN